MYVQFFFQADKQEHILQYSKNGTFLKKQIELKNCSKSGTLQIAIRKVEKDYKQCLFFGWIDEFTKQRETKSNIQLDEENSRKSESLNSYAI